MTGIPPDPWELTPEEIEERIAGKPEPIRALLEAMWRQAPRTRLNLQALAEMPSMGSLYAAVDVMTEEEVRSALFLAMWTAHRNRPSPEELQSWEIPPGLEP